MTPLSSENHFRICHHFTKERGQGVSYPEKAKSIAHRAQRAVGIEHIAVKGLELKVSHGAHGAHGAIFKLIISKIYLLTVPLLLAPCSLPFAFHLGDSSSSHCASTTSSSSLRYWKKSFDEPISGCFVTTKYC